MDSSGSLLSIYVAMVMTGSVWTMFHCPAMCGPLMIAFRFGARPDGSVRMLSALGGVLMYQLGRSLVYAAIGAVAGSLGAVVGDSLRLGMPILSMLVAGLLLLMAIAEMGWLRLPGFAVPAPLARLAGRFAGRGAWGDFTLGMVMAVLPCGLTWWAVGLAASSASPLHGAALMVLLVLLTLPWLALAAALPGVLGRVRLINGRWLVAAGLAASALYLGFMSWRAWPVEVSESPQPTAPADTPPACPNCP